MLLYLLNCNIPCDHFKKSLIGFGQAILVMIAPIQIASTIKYENSHKYTDSILKAYVVSRRDVNKADIN